MPSPNSAAPGFAGIPVAQVREAPFFHFVGEPVFAPEIADAAHAWLDAYAPWRRHVASFFDQFECSALDMCLPPPLHQALTSVAALRAVRDRMQELVGAELADVIAVVAHRLVPGQGIGVHTDRPLPGSETYRMVVPLGPGEFHDSDGGHLLFFDDDDQAAPACAFRGIHNTAVGFELTDASFHAVTELSRGIRYTLVYSFWPADYGDEIESPGLPIPEFAQVQAGAQPRRRAPHAATVRELDALTQVLVEAGAAELPAPEQALLPDLVHAYEVLRRWDRDDALCLAGLFFGVYGAELGGPALIPRDQRERVRAVIGERAEALVHAVCAARMATLEQALFCDRPGLVEDRFAGGSLGLTGPELGALATLLLAFGVAAARGEPSGEHLRAQRRLLALARPRLDEQVRGYLERLYDDRR